MKFLSDKKILLEYSIYIVSILLQILLVLASAKFLTDDAFVKFNVYLAFINIAVIIINFTSVNYLMINTINILLIIIVYKQIKVI